MSLVSSKTVPRPQALLVPKHLARIEDRFVWGPPYPSDPVRRRITMGWATLSPEQFVAVSSAATKKTLGVKRGRNGA